MIINNDDENLKNFIDNKYGLSYSKFKWRTWLV